MGLKHPEFDVVGPLAYLTPEQEAATGLESPVEIHTLKPMEIALALHSQLLNANLTESERQSITEKVRVVNHLEELLAPYIRNIIGIESHKEFGVTPD